MNAKAKAAAPLPPQIAMTNLRQSGSSAGNVLTDARAKQVLKEAVDAVVNSFAKHTQGYGRDPNADNPSNPIILIIHDVA
ncbi:hypothetical protein WDU94_014350 [Cyamophila willieti]